MQDILLKTAERLGIPITEGMLEETETSSSSEWDEEQKEQNFRQILKRELIAAELANHPEGSPCPFCDGSGWVVVVKADEEARTVNTVARQCCCFQQKQTEWSLSKAGISSMQKKYNFGNYKTKYAWQRDIKRRALEYLKQANEGAWFFIGGQSGSGKTHICVSITTELVRNGFDGMYMLWREESSRLKALRCDFDKYNFILDKYIKPKLLYVDDFLNCGEGEPTDADLRLAYELLNRRYMDESTVTIISSEYYLEEINKISAAVGGRIFERSKLNTFGIPRRDSNNMRLEKNKEGNNGQQDFTEI